MLRTNYICVTQHQGRLRHLGGKFTQYAHFLSIPKVTCLDRTIYLWQGFNLLGCPLILRRNYRCVQSLNIIVDVAKCVENFHKFT